jgi:hypothetical protein
MDIAPATNPATPATKMATFGADEAATPIMRLAVETMASSEPSTAARNQPSRPLRCISRGLLQITGVAFISHLIDRRFTTMQDYSPVVSTGREVNHHARGHLAVLKPVQN